MSAFNVVRFRVKPGLEEQFIEAHRQRKTRDFVGFKRGVLVKTGDRSYCMIGEWNDMSSIEKSRTTMISFLDGFRDMLEDLGGGLGVTDPVSGEVVLNLEP
jgi:quinol monooxygenase YgiN